MKTFIVMILLFLLQDTIISIAQDTCNLPTPIIRNLPGGYANGEIAIYNQTLYFSAAVGVPKSLRKSFREFLMLCANFLVTNSKGSGRGISFI